MLRRVLAVAVTVAACTVLSASAPASLVGGPEPLRFGPSWMPAGFVELGRQYGAPVREWAPAGTRLLAGSGASVELRPEFNCLDRRDPVDVGGRPAWYFDRTVSVPLERGVCWEPAGSGSLKLETKLTSVSRDDLLRIARSVRPAPGSTAFPISVPPVTPVRFGVENYDGWKRVAGRSPTDWTATVSWSPSSRYGKQDLEITAGYDTAAPDGGERLTIDGKHARYVRAAESTYLVVDFGARRHLTIRVRTWFDAPPPLASTLADLAERTTVDLSPKSWIGARNLVGRGPPRWPHHAVRPSWSAGLVESGRRGRKPGRTGDVVHAGTGEVQARTAAPR